METTILIVLVVVIFVLAILYLKDRPKKTGLGVNDSDVSTVPDIEDVKPNKPDRL